MNKTLRIAFGAICLLGLPCSVQAQYYTGVFDVYYQSVVYPERFDQYVANNQSLFNFQFFSCLNALEQVWLPQAQQEAATCDALLDPHFKTLCLQNMQFVPLVTWSASVRLVLTNQRTWGNTTSGQLATYAKTLTCNMLGCDTFVAVMNQSLLVVRPRFLCN
jgi:hypothetical protein